MSKKKDRHADAAIARDAGLAVALRSALAVAEFSPKGRLISANQEFLDLLGYALDEIAGGPHRILVDSDSARSPEYADFWTGLGSGSPRAGEFKCLRKDGAPVFMKAAYLPVRSADGRVERVFAAAWDFTPEKLRAIDAEGQMQAIGRSQATIEFGLDGTVLTANRNFLELMGYSLEEIVGKHHSIFVDSEYGRSQAYQDFWESLKSGIFQQAEFKRIGKDGREVWIQASYTPILDADDRPFKVVKYATDITDQKRRNLNFQSQIEAITTTQAVVEFDLDGEILTANSVFLSAMGYSLEEVRGRHHRMFVAPEEAQSAEYAELWRALRSGHAQTGQYIRLAKDGTRRWLQASYTPIPDLDGGFHKVVKYATDLTAERKLRDTMLDDLAQPIAALASSSEQLLGISGALTDHARNTSESATIAAGRTEEVASAMQTVAGSAEELTITVREISRQTADGSAKATHAKDESDKANQMIEQLNDSSNAIGKIIKTISSIAQQTNLLALNATIEAARAGEAGKGFAVVANEVKELAKQTSMATDDITNRVEAIQAASDTAVGSIKAISEVIDGLSEISLAIATAVEEQAGTTNELARIVADSATAVYGVSENITDVNGMAVQTLAAGRDTEASAKGLGELASKLGDTIARLKQM